MIFKIGEFYQTTLGVDVTDPYSFDLVSRQRGPNAAIPTEENVSG